jgi:hypothetical protein
MITQQERGQISGAATNTAVSYGIETHPEIHIYNDGTIQSLNEKACELLDIDTPLQAEGQSIKQFLPISPTSVTNSYNSFFEETFSASEQTVIPTVNARYAYTFSFDSDLNAVKLIVKDNPFV